MNNNTGQQTAGSRNAVQTIARSLARRHARERRFRRAGLTAVCIALGLVLVLFANILYKGIPAFRQATLTLPVYFDPEIIKIDPRPERGGDEADAAYQQRMLAWRTQLAMVNWWHLLDKPLMALLPDATDKDIRAVRSLLSSGERFVLRNMVDEDPSVIGQTVPVRLLADAQVDVWLKGNVDRSLPDNRLQLSRKVRDWVDQLYARGDIRMAFSSALFTNPDSRSSPASAGLAGAMAGSLYMMLIVIVLAVPVGVASAVYLEEFAHRNWITDFIEVNINNLAAVPSIIFGLLGAVIFINWMHLPLSAPLVGGLVLSLMTLPTVIITARSSLRAVSPSLRQAALGLGASPVQTVFQHVLPQALPGILTGAIIGVAQAIGETAPLLLIGMTAFVAAVPHTVMDQSTALPVQIYLWQGNELRSFFESRTSAAIIVLLALMLMLNAFAIWLRRKFEVKT